jgi:hypothetical protein
MIREITGKKLLNKDEFVTAGGLDLDEVLINV